MNIFFAIHRFVQAQPATNYERLLPLLEEASSRGADLVILPPDAISGFATASLADNGHYREDCYRYWLQLARQFQHLRIVSTQNGNTHSQFVVLSQGKVEYVAEDQYTITGEQESFFLYHRTQQSFPDNVTPIYFSHEPFYKDSPYCRKFIPSRGLMISALGLQDKGHLFFTHDGWSGNNQQRISQFSEGVFSANEPAVAASIAPHAPLCFALQEFYQRQQIANVVIGLSGGIDSALNLLLHRQIFPTDKILAVNMPSPYNSTTTKSIAAHLAEKLAVPYITVPIHESIAFTKTQLETELAVVAPHELTSFMLENVQARDRSTRILAGLAAMRQAVFTCNGNKTEFTIGYGTMYGDISGAHAVLGDLWKYEVKQTAAEINTRIYGGQALPDTIFTMQPSAELSPAQAVEKGLGDPLVYDYHDYLFRYWVDHPEHPDLATTLEHYLAGDLADVLGTSLAIDRLFPDKSSFIADMERWWRMYKGLAVAKRMQAPPVFAFSPTAFGSQIEAQGELYFPSSYLNLKNN